MVGVTTTKLLTPEELVLEKYPNAFVDDNGEWVYIRNQKETTENCPHCGQKWTRLVIDYTVGGTLGAGGDKERAWDDTAKRFGLI